MAATVRAGHPARMTAVPRVIEPISGLPAIGRCGVAVASCRYPGFLHVKGVSDLEQAG